MAFVKGQSGNPNGRPKGAKSLSDAIRRRIKERKLEDKIADAVIDQAIEGNSASMKMLLERVDGAVKQETDVTSDGQPIQQSTVVILPSNGRDEGT